MKIIIEMFYFTQFKTSKFDIAVLCLPNCRQKVAVNTAWAHPRVYSEDHLHPGSMLMLMVVIVAVMFLALVVLVDSAYLFLCEHSREETHQSMPKEYQSTRLKKKLQESVISVFWLKDFCMYSIDQFYSEE